MPHSTTPDGHALPGSVLRFAEQDAGLLVFAGSPEAVSASAELLASHIEGATGRTAEHRASEGLRLAAAGPRLLVDDQPGISADRLFALMDEAEDGALVIATMGAADRNPYLRLLDLVELGEDSDYRMSFDRVFYAVARVQPGGTVDGADVKLGPRPGLWR